MLELPEHIKKEMKMFRIVGTNVPNSYINFHKEKATADFEAREKNGDWHILEVNLVDDGWFDGFKVIELEIAEKVNMQWIVSKLKWHDSGAWFKNCCRYAEMLK